MDTINLKELSQTFSLLLEEIEATRLLLSRIDDFIWAGNLASAPGESQLIELINDLHPQLGKVNQEAKQLRFVGALISRQAEQQQILLKRLFDCLSGVINFSENKTSYAICSINNGEYSLDNAKYSLESEQHRLSQMRNLLTGLALVNANDAAILENILNLKNIKTLVDDIISNIESAGADL